MVLEVGVFGAAKRRLQKVAVVAKALLNLSFPANKHVVRDALDF